MQSLAGSSRFEARVIELKHAFEARTGAYASEDEWFDVRSAAFLDDALASQGLARAMVPELSPEHAAYVGPIERAHRGLFRASKHGRSWLVVDAWSGAEFAIDAPEPGLADAVASAAGYFDGRVVACGGEKSTIEIVLMPGAVFHAEEANGAIDALVPLARTRKLRTGDFLDALLRMDHALRSLSRVRVAFAYRAEALPRG